MDQFTGPSPAPNTGWGVEAQGHAADLVPAASPLAPARGNGRRWQPYTGLWRLQQCNDCHMNSCDQPNVCG